MHVRKSLFKGYSSAVLKNARFRADISLWKALDMETWQEGQMFRKDTFRAVPAADAVSAVPAQTVVSGFSGSITQGCRAAEPRDAGLQNPGMHGTARLPVTDVSGRWTLNRLKRLMSFCYS